MTAKEFLDQVSACDVGQTITAAAPTPEGTHTHIVEVQDLVAVQALLELMNSNPESRVADIYEHSSSYMKFWIDWCAYLTTPE